MIKRKEIKETGYEDPPQKKKPRKTKLYICLTVEDEAEHFDLRLRTDPTGRETL